MNVISPPACSLLAAAEWREGWSDCGPLRPQRDSPSSVHPGGEGSRWAESPEAGPPGSRRNGGSPSASQ